MAIEVLVHKTYGSHHQLAQYCVSHKSLYFPKVDIQSFEFGKNKIKYTIETKSAYEYTVSYANNNTIFFANVPLKSDEKWSWEIFISKKLSNNSDYFGIDSIENTSQPGYSKQNSWGFNVDHNRIHPY
eukprot:76366_1